MMSELMLDLRMTSGQSEAPHGKMTELSSSRYSVPLMDL